MKLKMFTAIIPFLILTPYMHAINNLNEQEDQSPIHHVEIEVGLLDEIIESTKTMVFSQLSKEEHKKAKKELTSLVKQLDPTIQEIIKPEIDVIKNPAKNAYTQLAYKHLVAKIDAIKAEVQLIETTERATDAIAGAADDQKAQTIVQQAEAIENAKHNAEQKGILGNLKSRVFGDETSWAQAALYTAVGAAVTGALYYGYQNADDIVKRINTSWLHMMKTISRYKSPLEFFVEDLVKLKSINGIAHKAQEQYNQHPTEENYAMLQYAMMLLSQQSDVIQNRYDSLTPDAQKAAEQMVNRIME